MTELRTVNIEITYALTDEIALRAAALHDPAPDSPYPPDLGAEAATVIRLLTTVKNADWDSLEREGLDVIQFHVAGGGNIHGAYLSRKTPPEGDDGAQ